MKTCKDLRNSDTPYCCISCHEDYDNGSGDLMEKKIGGKTYEVCCALSVYIHDKEMED